MVIGLLTDSFNNYAYRALSEADAQRFNRLHDAEGGDHREFCEILGPSRFFHKVSGIVTLADHALNETILKRLTNHISHLKLAEPLPS
jgi:hypothetical protein